MDMTTLIIIMGAAIWIGVIAWAVHGYRRRQQDREHERSMRYEQLIGSAITSLPAGTVATAPASPAASAQGAVPVTAPAVDPARLAALFMASRADTVERFGSATGARMGAALMPAALMPAAPILPAPAYQLRERVLDKQLTLALHVIRTAMPGHEVFVGLSLASLLDVPDSVRGYDRELRLRKLAPLTVDFAIANKAMRLVAVIDLEDVNPPEERVEAQRAKAEYLRAFPVRHLTFSRACMPRYQDIRQLLRVAD